MLQSKPLILLSLTSTGKKNMYKSNPNNHILFTHTQLISHPRGRPRLRNALAASYSEQFNRKLDPETEILVTAGANEGKKTVNKAGVKVYFDSFWLL
jgi:DNA-binding transcriptional MocR family regulator